jgi:hypothetical protein
MSPIATEAAPRSSLPKSANPSVYLLIMPDLHATRVVQAMHADMMLSPDIIQSIKQTSSADTPLGLLQEFHELAASCGTGALVATHVAEPLDPREVARIPSLSVIHVETGDLAMPFRSLNGPERTAREHEIKASKDLFEALAAQLEPSRVHRVPGSRGVGGQAIWIANIVRGALGQKPIPAS